MAWKPEVLVRGKWCQNGLAFPTEQEASENAADLMYRWTAVDDSRAVEIVGLPANYTYVGRKLQALIND